MKAPAGRGQVFVVFYMNQPGRGYVETPNTPAVRRGQAGVGDLTDLRR